MPPRPDTPRIVVTGLGMVTPFGSDCATSWRGLLSGRSATRALAAAEIGLTEAAANGAPQFIGAPGGRGWRLCEAPAVAEPGLPFGPAPATQAKCPRDLDPVLRLALMAASEAWADAGLEGAGVDRRRIGCVVSSSKGGLQTFSRLLHARLADEVESLPPELWWQVAPNAPTVFVAERFKLLGPWLAPVAACATGLACCLRGADLIRDGVCEVVLAGSADASLQPAILASFSRMGVLARDVANPARACRPFDRTRSGFVIGEGAGVLVLESLEHARARGATIHAEWLGGGAAADVSGLTQLDVTGATLARLIRDVIRRGGLGAEDLDYINLHGTGTVRNDLCETRAIRQSLGPFADHVRCSSLKGGTGHLLGAAGSVELIATILALRDQVVPPTVNLREPDPDCDLNYTPLTAQTAPLDHALKLSLGFGGHLFAAVLKRWSL